MAFLAGPQPSDGRTRTTAGRKEAVTACRSEAAGLAASAGQLSAPPRGNKLAALGAEKAEACGREAGGRSGVEVFDCFRRRTGGIVSLSASTRRSKDTALGPAAENQGNVWKTKFKKISQKRNFLAKNYEQFYQTGSCLFCFSICLVEG
jgi:hypothetical protein